MYLSTTFGIFSHMHKKQESPDQATEKPSPDQNTPALSQISIHPLLIRPLLIHPPPGCACAPSIPIGRPYLPLSWILLQFPAYLPVNIPIYTAFVPYKSKIMLHLEIPQMQFPDPAVLNPLLHRGPVKEGDASVLLQQLEDYMYNHRLHGYSPICRSPLLRLLQVLRTYSYLRPE